MRDLIVFGEDFGGLPSSTQHLIKNMSANRKVLWVNSIGLRQPQLNGHDLKRVWSKLTAISNPTTTSTKRFCNVKPDHFHTVNLMTIPAPQGQLARYIAKKAMAAQIQKQIERYGLEKPIVWTSLPTAADVCEELDHSGIVYYCGDDFSALAGVDHETVAIHEEKLVDQADLIVTVSETLTDKFPNTKTLLLPHGVDYDLFSQTTKPACDFPCPIANPDSPTAGFYGSLSEWLDYSLIEKIASEQRHWQFIFIGPSAYRKNPLPNLDNIHYLGPREHAALPSYSQHWDVSLLPFRTNAQIQACNPLKLLEYFAAGSPIVATRFPALEKYSQYLHLVNTAEQFSQALSSALSATPVPATLVEDQSWRAKAQHLDRLLEQL